MLSNILIAVGLALMVIVIPVCLIIAKVTDRFEECTMAIIFLSLIALAIGSIAMKMKSDEQKTQIQLAVNNSYEIYVDGQYVEPEHIDLTQYDKVTVDDEKQVILVATTKSR